MLTKYSHNSGFFSSPHMINSYWAGFIAADGCIVKEKNSIVLNLSSCDAQHLKRFQEDIEFTGNVKAYRDGKVSSLWLCNAVNLIKDLELNYHITERKTKTLKPPPLTDNLALAYVIGLIDGDGYIGITNSSGRTRIHLSLIGTDGLMRWVKSIFDKKFPLRYARMANVTYGSGYAKYSLSGKRAMDVLSELNKIQVPKLLRKWSKI